ncbi:MAG: hypothetical protein AAGJ79_11385 [Verrucomicrobiota bacterium]
MNVLIITIFVSLCLAAVFTVCFAMESKRRRHGSIGQDALLPFKENPKRKPNDPNLLPEDSSK